MTDDKVVALIEEWRRADPGSDWWAAADELEEALAAPAEGESYATPDDIGLSMGPDDVPHLLVAGAKVARFPAGSWGAVCDALDSITGTTPPAASVDVELRESLKDIQQMIHEVTHAQSVGASWYTRGESGLYAQVYNWLQKGQAALTKIDALIDSAGGVQVCTCPHAEQENQS